tara:strand:- start:5245 stop:5355 length:111 start_codon:yes stop_codon:yes gene_type:complete
MDTLVFEVRKYGILIKIAWKDFIIYNKRLNKKIIEV